MQHTRSIWSRWLRRASGLLERHTGSRLAPESSWSTVGQAARRFEHALPPARDRDHAHGLWTRAMASVLDDLCRRGRATPRGVDTSLDGPEDESEALDAETLAALDEALLVLAALDERKVVIVVLRHFHGLAWEDLAHELGLPVGSVRREWDFSVAWLRRDLRRRGVEMDRLLEGRDQR